jgi:hypothetical protein
MMSEYDQQLQTRLAHLMRLITDARASGNAALADLLSDAAAKCLMQLADKGYRPPEPEPPVSQSQQRPQQTFVDRIDELE